MKYPSLYDRDLKPYVNVDLHGPWWCKTMEVSTNLDSEEQRGKWDRGIEEVEKLVKRMRE